MNDGASGDMMPAIKPGDMVAATKDPFLAMVERVAQMPDVNVDTLERLLAMQERVMMRTAEGAFNDAMRECQSEMKTIIADADNKQVGRKYASFPALDRALRPIYTKHGFSISFNTEPLEREAVRVVAIVSKGMFTREYRVDIPADGKGAKGGDVMTKTHAVGSAMRYGARYLMLFIFNAAVAESDDDGNAAGGAPTPDAEGQKLLEACGSVAALEDCWAKKLTREQRETLVGVLSECKVRIRDAEKAAKASS